MNQLAVLEIEAHYGGIKRKICPVLLRDEREMMLIDCGFPGFLPLVQAAAKAKGFDISNLTKIIITHHDYDHMGALAEFKRAYPNIKVLASIDDEKYISGKEKSLRLQQAEAAYHALPNDQKENAKKYQQTLTSVEKVEVDEKLQDKDWFPCCGGVEIVATPGHMPGHISVYIKESKTLVTGDALVLENGEVAGANPQYTLDMATAKKSIKKLLDYEIDRLICYHGGIYEKAIKESLQKFV